MSLFIFSHDQTSMFNFLLELRLTDKLAIIEIWILSQVYRFTHNTCIKIKRIWNGQSRFPFNHHISLLLLLLLLTVTQWHKYQCQIIVDLMNRNLHTESYQKHFNDSIHTNVISKTINAQSMKSIHEIEWICVQERARCSGNKDARNNKPSKKNVSLRSRERIRNWDKFADRISIGIECYRYYKKKYSKLRSTMWNLCRVNQKHLLWYNCNGIKMSESATNQCFMVENALLHVYC